MASIATVSISNHNRNKIKNQMKNPKSPREEVRGLVYFARLCDKVRLYEAGELAQEYHANLGKAMDLWTCQLLEKDYQDIVTEVKSGKSDVEVLEWAFLTGCQPSELQITWWNSYMRNAGNRDHLAERLAERIKSTFFDAFC